MGSVRPTYDRVAVIPYRYVEGKVEVLLVTTKGSGRWIFPKGHIEPHLGQQATAALEAFEEAGVEGRIHLAPIGSYTFGRTRKMLQINVYLLKVTRVLDNWPEARERERRWMLIKEALNTVADDMKPLLHVAAEILH